MIELNSKIIIKRIYIFYY